MAPCACVRLEKSIALGRALREALGDKSGIRRYGACHLAMDEALVRAIQAALAGLEHASVLSADGRRRMFALRGSTGERVGSAAVAPAPGRSEAFWMLFPAAAGPVSLLLPGFVPLPGLLVPPAGQPEP